MAEYGFRSLDRGLELSGLEVHQHDRVGSPLRKDTHYKRDRQNRTVDLRTFAKGLHHTGSETDGTILIFKVKIGDKLIDFNAEFKMFLCTRNSDVSMTPTEQGLLNVINFTVTRSGLEGILLSIIINYEQPELE